MQCESGVEKQSQQREREKTKKKRAKILRHRRVLCDTADIIQALSAFVLAPWLAWNGLPKAMAGFPTFSKVFFTSLV